MDHALNIKRRNFLALGVGSLILPFTGCKNNLDASLASINRLDSLIQAEMKTARIPGLAIGLARGGKTLLTKGYGYANINAKQSVTPDTLFHIASITKTVTATSVLQLSERGHFKLDDSIDPYLDFDVKNPFHKDAKMTFRQLLNHTSGISDKKAYEIDYRVKGRDSNLPLKTFLQDYLTATGQHYSPEKCFLKFLPGENWSYSNIGYSLLGYLVEVISGKNLRDFSRDEIFKPLGMSKTFWSLAEANKHQNSIPYQYSENTFMPLEPVGFPDWPAGMIRSSITDIIKFTGASANNGSYGGQNILSQDSAKEMLSMVNLAGLPAWLTGQGLGWGASKLKGNAKPNHWGGDPGVFTAAYLEPETNSSIVILMNTDATAETRVAMKKIVAFLFNDKHNYK